MADLPAELPEPIVGNDFVAPMANGDSHSSPPRQGFGLPPVQVSGHYDGDLGLGHASTPLKGKLAGPGVTGTT